MCTSPHSDRSSRRGWPARRNAGSWTLMCSWKTVCSGWKKKGRSEFTIPGRRQCVCSSVKWGKNRFSKKKSQGFWQSWCGWRRDRDSGVNRRRRGTGRGHWEPEQPRWVSELQSNFISLSVRFELVSFFTPFFLKLQKKRQRAGRVYIPWSDRN